MSLCDLNSPSPSQSLANLVVFHHAGGNASYYKSWSSDMTARGGIRLIGVNLPNRMPNRPIVKEHTMGSIVDLILEDFRSHGLISSPLPLILFGHSLGGVVAYEVTRRLQQLMPMSGVSSAPRVSLIISAVRNPQQLTEMNSNPNTLFKHLMTDDELFRYVESIGGLPTGVHPDFLRLLLPVIRRDYKLYETYKHEPGPSLLCPLIALAGAVDNSLDKSSVADCNRVTRKMYGN